ncbi:hypothetical protein [Yinghuangia sp. YIM S10712]|uniref:hypothetical protein n=1 Tax=Yinghuangia sp. YIM S10712 TaxID=3436930 RepID=UPI003F529792
MVMFGVIALVVAALALATAPTGLCLSRARLMTCADAAHADGRVVVFGAVEPLPDGLVRAPVSGRACVWFTSAAVEYWVEQEPARVRDFDGDGPLHHSELRPARRGRGRTEVRSSDRPFLLRDDTGAVVVDPVGLRAVRLPVASRDTVGGGVPQDGVVAVDFGARRMRRVSRCDRSETVLAAGERVYVSGRVERRPDGVVLTGRSSTISREQPGGSSPLPTLRARVGLALGALAGLIGVAALLAGSARH